MKIFPPPKKRQKQLPDKARALGVNESVLCATMNAARCVRAWGVKQKWDMVQRTEKNGVRVWRLS